MNSSLGSGNTQSRQHITKWWKEVVLILSIYGVYTATRNMFGSAYVNGSDIPVHAFNNAMKIIRLERVIGLFHEESVQQWFLPYRLLIQFLNTYYGTAHFAVTIGVFIVLYRRRKDVFPLFRNALVFTTVLALIGFIGCSFRCCRRRFTGRRRCEHSRLCSDDATKCQQCANCAKQCC